MPFPESDRVVYAKTPLLQVICQLRFPPILEIGISDPAAFQNLVRSDYPLYEKRFNVPSQPPNALQKMSVLLSPSAAVHIFKSDSGHREINLSNDTLTVADTAYERWEDFAAFMALTRDAFETTYRPAHYSRLGLRYINIINRQDLELMEVPWSELINPALASVVVDAAIGAEVEEVNAAAMIRLEDVLIRLQYGLAKEVSRPDDVGFLIDADVFSTIKEGSQHVATKLANFHRSARSLFRWAITDRLHKAMDPSELEQNRG